VPKPRTTSAPAYLDSPTIPIAYLQLLVEILGERGIGEATLFDEPQLSRALLSEPRMSAIQWTRLVRRALALTQDPGLGYEYGLRMRPTAHGLLGFAAMSADSVRAASEIVVRYASARQAHFELALEEEAEHCQLVLRERYPIPVLRSFFLENILLGLARGFAVLLGRDLSEFPGYEICFDMPEPDYYAAWKERLARVRFDQQARALCEQELSYALEGSHDLSARVVAQLRQGKEEGGYASLEDVAARLKLSTRTLKRRLAEGGTSFSQLLRETRTGDARDFLVRTELSVQDIAARLGYQNPANFSRAFAQETGVPPSAYRAQHKSRTPL
jgi:AraC-like DNA-binding protein